MDDDPTCGCTALTTGSNRTKNDSGIAIFKSALSVTIIALFPPSSKILRPSREATLAETLRPCWWNQWRKSVEFVYR